MLVNSYALFLPNKSGHDSSGAEGIAGHSKSSWMEAVGFLNFKSRDLPGYHSNQIWEHTTKV